MKHWLLTTIGVVLTVAGTIWALQGFGEIGGSFMSGDSVWAVIGPVVAVIGLAVWGVSLRRTAAGAPAPGAGPAQGSPTTATTGAAAVKVSIDNFVFQPKELVVTAGTSVTWVNTDDAAHTVTSKAAPPLATSPACA